MMNEVELGEKMKGQPRGMLTLQERTRFLAEDLKEARELLDQGKVISFALQFENGKFKEIALTSLLPLKISELIKKPLILGVIQEDGEN